MKRCTQCGELKPESEFYAAPGCKDGLRGNCKDCHRARGRAWYAANSEASKAYVTRWKRAHPDRLREYRQKQDPARRALQMRRLHLRRKFGMTLEQYDQILAAQEGGCAICGEPPVEGKSIHIDHAGDTVRGLLCVRCNNALGQLRDDPELMLRAAEYVTLGGFAPLHLVDDDADRDETPDAR